MPEPSNRSGRVAFVALFLSVALIAALQIYSMRGAPKSGGAVLPRMSNLTPGATTLADALLLLGLAGLFLVVRFLLVQRGQFGRSARPLIPAGPLIKAFVHYLLAYYILQQIADVVVADGGERELAARLALMMASMFAALAVGMYSLPRNVTADELRSTGYRLPRLASGLSWGFGGYTASILPVIGALLVSGWLVRTVLHGMPTPEHPLLPVLRHGRLPLAMAFAVAVAIAPVVEEIAFRGLLYSGLRGVMGAWSAVFVSAGVFAVVHPTLPGQFLPLMVLGVVLAVVREATGSVAPGMICHAANNLVALIQVLLLSTL